MPASHAVDQVARDRIFEALSKIDAHEKVCDERAVEAKTWRIGANEKLDRIEAGINNKIAAMTEAIKVVYNRIWLSMVGLISLLLAVTGYLIAHKGL